MSQSLPLAENSLAGSVTLQPGRNGQSKAFVSEPPFLKADSGKSLSSDAFGHDSGYGEEPQQVFAQRRNRLLALITGTKSIIKDMTGSAGIMYPSSALKRAFGPGHMLTRNRSVHDDIPVAAEPPKSPADENPLQILQLDVKSYAYKGSVADLNPNDQGLVSQLLQGKLQEISQHLDRLNARISDTRSKVLVTGDLNAGKSTFVNAILRREVVPDDQQPCTALFAEVVDSEQNNGIEEVHGIKHPEKYDRCDPTTFTRFDFRHLREVVEDNVDGYEQLKIYCRDKRERKQSLLHNGIVDISLIDSPGLNIDSIKTTALFSQQEEIDVIVFVVNAENHFTLSGRDFLTTAGKEKAYIFIVINKFDQIRRKDRCRREILEQIRQISPRTYEEGDNLVHFVSAKQLLNHKEGEDTSETMISEFHKMEDALRSFILEKRSRSKLAPAKIYLHNLLTDIITISRYNTLEAVKRAESVTAEMRENAPVYDRMLQIKTSVLDSIDKTIDGTGQEVQEYAEKMLDHFVERIWEYTEDVEFGGVLYIWQYARDLRNRVYSVAASRLRRCEDFARDRAVKCLRDIDSVAKDCMSMPPSIDMDVIKGMFEGDMSTANASTRVATSSPPSAQIVPLPVADFFDHADKAELTREYAPSVGLIVGGLIGYRHMAGQMLGLGGNVIKANSGKLAFAGITIAGIGIFLYALSNLPRTLERKVVSKMRDHFLSLHFTSSNAQRLASGTKRVLRLAIWDFQSQFQRILRENEDRREKMEGDVREAERCRNVWGGVETKARRLKEEVESVHLET
ncbi:mitofusin [Gaertneriomyces sp. JEL0708]|nr:mitofusin [Gaertneriomyces sp. JEL0708]